MSSSSRVTNSLISENEVLAVPFPLAQAHRRLPELAVRCLRAVSTQICQNMFVFGSLGFLKGFSKVEIVHRRAAIGIFTEAETEQRIHVVVCLIDVCLGGHIR